MIAVAGVLSGAAVLGGCAQSGNVVATVGGTRISQSQFNTAVSGAAQVSQLTPDQVLSVLIQGEVAAQVARQHNITITDADRDKQLNPAVLQIPDAHDLAYDLADVQIVSGAVGQQTFTKALTSTHIAVNPRFGTWAPKQSFAVVPGSGSLSQVAANRPK
jgi:preprotein translocase subunit SecF